MAYAEDTHMSEDPNHKKATILLIEDEPILVQLYAKALAKQPATVVTAHNKRSALEAIAEHKPDIILLDLMIPFGPGEDLINYEHPVGFDILEWVRHHPEYNSTKVAIMTNLDSDEHKKHAESLGVSKFLVKSDYEPKSISAIVTELLG